MECQLTCKPKNCPRGLLPEEVDCFSCPYFEQLDAVHYINGEAVCTCTKEVYEEEEND